MEQTEFQLFRLEILKHINRIFEALATSDDVAARGVAMFEVCWLKARLETYEARNLALQDAVYNQLADGLIEARHNNRMQQWASSFKGGTDVLTTTED